MDKEKRIKTQAIDPSDSYDDKFEQESVVQFDYVEKESPKGQFTVKLSTLIVALVATVIAAVVIIIGVIFFVTSGNNDDKTQISSSSSTQSDKSNQKATQPQTKIKADLQGIPEHSKETEPETKAEKKFEPYLMKIERGLSIFDGPGYEYQPYKGIQETGTYTIVEEFYDKKANTTWGRLKSGAGWVDLEFARTYVDRYADDYTKAVEEDVFEPYIVSTSPGTDVYSGPGTEYECVMVLEEQGAYTIVEEFYNSESNSIWGKLESGAGWINLG